MLRLQRAFGLTFSLSLALCGSCDQQSKFAICTDGTSKFIPVEAILAEQGCNAPLWVNTLVLLGFLVVFRLLGYLVLRFIRCPK